ncbi:MAG: YdbL family protein [Candidatus Omnitrophica bacterium]|nr:YdbL family protein [Candidatus Omnitrophota bacterium]
MKKVFAVFFLMIMIACAKVSVETTKPIKVDINLRVDIYQHVQKDVDSIMDEIYSDQQSRLNSIFVLPCVYAADFSSQVNEAIQGIKSRLSKMENYFASGYIGENKDGALEVVADVPDSVSDELLTDLKKENADREVLYRATADKNGASLSDVRKIFFEKHYEKAADGSFFEAYDQATDAYIWKKK